MLSKLDQIRGAFSVLEALCQHEPIALARAARKNGMGTGETHRSRASFAVSQRATRLWSLGLAVYVPYGRGAVNSAGCKCMH